MSDKTAMTAAEIRIEAAEFRRVLGSYPTGVCAITAMIESGPCVMVVGSFSSVSLDPPLIGFFPGRQSNSWRQIESAGRFCVNVLGSHQFALSQQFAASGSDKFAGISYSLSAGGAPIIDEAIAWIDCDMYSVTEAGDHYFVLGRVTSLDVVGEGAPLVFHRGRYGGFLLNE